MEVVRSVCPHSEDVVDISHKDIWLLLGRSVKLTFETVHEDDRKGWGDPAAHGDAAGLTVVTVAESEIVVRKAVI